MPKLVTVLVCILALGICSCGVASLKQSDTAQLKLLPPDEGPAAVLLKQKVTMISRGQEQQFIAVTRLQADRLKLVALLPSGQQLFFLEYDGEELIQENFSSMDLPVRDMLAIMQFALWPQRSVNHHYAAESGWLVESMPGQRTLLTASGVLIKVNYLAETILIENRLHDYQLIVQPLES